MVARIAFVSLLLPKRLDLLPFVLGCGCEEKYRLRAYTDQEMADELQVRRETVHDDRQSIEDDGAVFEQIERGRYKIKNASFLSQIRLNPLQSLPLYLLPANQHDK